MCKYQIFRQKPFFLLKMPIPTKKQKKFKKITIFFVDLAATTIVE
jgi:hypothetical protein